MVRGQATFTVCYCHWLSNELEFCQHNMLVQLCFILNRLLSSHNGTLASQARGLITRDEMFNTSHPMSTTVQSPQYMSHWRKSEISTRVIWKALGELGQDHDGPWRGCFRKGSDGARVEQDERLYFDNSLPILPLSRLPNCLIYGVSEKNEIDENKNIYNGQLVPIEEIPPIAAKETTTVIEEDIPYDEEQMP